MSGNVKYQKPGNIRKKHKYSYAYNLSYHCSFFSGKSYDIAANKQLKQDHRQQIVYINNCANGYKPSKPMK